MWRPRDIERFEAAVLDGALEEAHDFDAKARLPRSGKELAKDLAAMTTDGGMLVYGVAEDDQGRPCRLDPIELADAPERIDQIAQASISPAPEIEIEVLRRADDARGYVLVRVPPSPDAPHQVTVDGDRRFYGRGETGNRRLSEEEIARLYERRERRSVDRQSLLAGFKAGLGFGEPTPGAEGFIHAIAQPTIPDDGLWERAVDNCGGERGLLDQIRDRIGSLRTHGWGGGSIGSALNWRRAGADKWSLDTRANTSVELPINMTARLEISMDGRGGLFYGGAVDRHNDRLIAYEMGIVVNLLQFLAAMGEVYEVGGYHGPVEIAYEVNGLRDAVGASRVGEFGFPPTPYGSDGARRDLRSQARTLRERPESVVRDLTLRLMQALTERDYDPLGDD